MARDAITADSLRHFLRELGRRFDGSGRLYLAGGAVMVYCGFRLQTEDIDYTAEIEGELHGFIEAIRAVIRALNLSAEPAGPGDFIPLPAGWRDRSPFIERFGRLDVYTTDPVAIALSKIERGSQRDLDDVLRLLGENLVTTIQLELAFNEILPRLETESLRVDADDFRRKFEAVMKLVKSPPDQ